MASKWRAIKTRFKKVVVNILNVIVFPLSITSKLEINKRLLFYLNRLYNPFQREKMNVDAVFCALKCDSLSLVAPAAVLGMELS